MLKTIVEIIKVIIKWFVTWLCILLIVVTISAICEPQNETYITDVEFVSAEIDRSDEIEIRIGSLYDILPWFEHNQYVTFFNYTGKDGITQKQCFIDKKIYNKVKNMEPGDNVKGVIEILKRPNYTLYKLKDIK